MKKTKALPPKSLTLIFFLSTSYLNQTSLWWTYFLRRKKIDQQKSRYKIRHCLFLVFTLWEEWYYKGYFYELWSVYAILMSQCTSFFWWKKDTFCFTPKDKLWNGTQSWVRHTFKTPCPNQRLFIESGLDTQYLMNIFKISKLMVCGDFWEKKKKEKILIYIFFWSLILKATNFEETIINGRWRHYWSFFPPTWKWSHKFMAAICILLPPHQTLTTIQPIFAIYGILRKR